MKVIGIDPGTAACGYGIVHESDGRLRAICHGWWQTPARERPELRLRTIFEGVQELIALHAPDAVALEESYVGADARTALSVGQARGAVLVAASSVGVACAEYPPARVKQAVCGYGRAEQLYDLLLERREDGRGASSSPRIAFTIFCTCSFSARP